MYEVGETALMCTVSQMSLSHNQMAYAAIISTLIFGSLFVLAPEEFFCPESSLP